MNYNKKSKKFSDFWAYTFTFDSVCPKIKYSYARTNAIFIQLGPNLQILLPDPQIRNILGLNNNSLAIGPITPKNPCFSLRKVQKWVYTRSFLV